jgi:mannose-6-phosphate isomerase
MSRFNELLQFTPLYQTRVWGGRKLHTVLGRQLPDAQPYGESWDLVDREHAQSLVAGGTWAGVSLHELWTSHRAEVFGEALTSVPSERFPLLIKVLDCADDLSLQVHPPADVAPALGGEPKTEMWFVAHADPEARIYAGIRAGVTRERFETALHDGTVATCVPTLDARTGDSLFVPSGRLHALGRGLLIYEIQQNSDTTYRVFDWNRMGLDGKPRALHVAQSLRCIDFFDVEPSLSHGDGVLAVCEHFRVMRVRTGHEMPPGRCRLIMPIRETHWGETVLAPGALTLCPASLELPSPSGEWLEIVTTASRPL